MRRSVRTPKREHARSMTPAKKKPGFFARLRQRLNNGQAWLSYDLGDLFKGKVDAAMLEELEERLLLADVGIEATEELMAALQKRLPRGADGEQAREALVECVEELLRPVQQPLQPGPQKPFVILVVGVNGTGKTTTIGKLAQRLSEQGHKIMLAAGDTFRAAAVEQLQVWADRAEVDFLAQAEGADPAAVAFDALAAAKARKLDVLITDTAGRLHNQAGLMDELKKISRVLAKQDAGAPHETLLVLDASQGQNALTQAEQFRAAVGVTGLVVTKLDGTARGGIVLAIARRLGLPIRFIGIGEGADDLAPFDAHEFSQALLFGTSDNTR
jgi:fused signal recognition particle receptor